MARRKQVSKTLRFSVMNRDGFKCVYCGKSPAQSQLEIDHVLPVSKGGKNTKDNLVTACFDCNRGKRDSIIGGPRFTSKARHQDTYTVRDDAGTIYAWYRPAICGDMLHVSLVHGRGTGAEFFVPNMVSAGHVVARMYPNKSDELCWQVERDEWEQVCG